MRAPLLLLCAFAVSCGGPLEGDSENQDLAAPRHLFTLAHAPVPSAHPTALVYLSKNFRKDGPLNLVVHYHGWVNCIANDGESRGSGRAGSHRAQPVRAARSERRQRGAGAHRTNALAHTLDRGGLTEHVTQVILLDSVYGNQAQFEAWAQAALGEARLAVVYTDNAGTLANSQKMANDAKSWVHAAGVSVKTVVDDRTTSTLPDSAFDAPILFKRSALPYDGTAQYYFGKLLAHAGLD